MPDNKTRNKRGFTLVEVLVVVSIIGILSGILVKSLNVQGLRSKTRDAQRISDLEGLKTSLELYFADNRLYPDDLVDLENGYISVVPTDPLTGDPYHYEPSNTNGNYDLACEMEISSSVDDNACEASVVSATGYTNCYQVQPPNN